MKDPRQQVEAIVENIYFTGFNNGAAPLTPNSEHSRTATRQFINAEIAKLYKLFDWIPVSSEEKPELKESILIYLQAPLGNAMHVIIYTGEDDLKNYFPHATHYMRIRPPQEKG